MAPESTIQKSCKLLNSNADMKANKIPWLLSRFELIRKLENLLRSAVGLDEKDCAASTQDVESNNDPLNDHEHYNDHISVAHTLFKVRSSASGRDLESEFGSLIWYCIVAIEALYQVSDGVRRNHMGGDWYSVMRITKDNLHLRYRRHYVIMTKMAAGRVVRRSPGRDHGFGNYGDNAYLTTVCIQLVIKGPLRASTRPLQTRALEGAEGGSSRRRRMDEGIGFILYGEYAITLYTNGKLRTKRLMTVNACMRKRRVRHNATRLMLYVHAKSAIICDASGFSMLSIEHLICPAICALTIYSSFYIYKALHVLKCVTNRVLVTRGFTVSKRLYYLNMKSCVKCTCSCLKRPSISYRLIVMGDMIRKGCPLSLMHGPCSPCGKRSRLQRRLQQRVLGSWRRLPHRCLHAAAEGSATIGYRRLELAFATVLLALARGLTYRSVGCYEGCHTAKNVETERLALVEAVIYVADVKATTELAGSCRGCHIGCRLLQRLPYCYEG
ncbi:hypothetical protein Tco_1546850 [Tanacetum coccineum]